MDILYDIKFERDDPSPMEEVLKVPSAFQVDEFAEYKRLRKAHRESQRHRKAHGFSDLDVAQFVPTKMAPQIASHVASAAHSFRSNPTTMPSSGNGSRIANLAQTSMKRGSNLSSQPVTNLHSLEDAPRSSVGDANATQAFSKSSLNVQTPNRIQEGATGALKSLASSDFTVRSHESDLREVTPWMDFDPQFALPMSEPMPPVRHIRRGKNQPEEQNPQTGNSSINTRSLVQNNEKESYTMRSPPPESFLAGGSLMKDGARSFVTTHPRQPVTKHFDGTKDFLDSDAIFDHNNSPVRANSMSPSHSPSKSKRHRQASAVFNALSSPSSFHPVSSMKEFLRERKEPPSPTKESGGLSKAGIFKLPGRVRYEQPCEVLVNFKDPFSSPDGDSKKD